MIKHTPLVRKITYIMGFTSIGLGVLSILFILGYQRWVLSGDQTCDEWLQEVIRPLPIEGRILDIQARDRCHDQLEVANFGELQWCHCGPNGSQPPRPDIGDSISKSPHTLSVTIFRPDSSRATLSFPCCD